MAGAGAAFLNSTLRWDCVACLETNASVQCVQQCGDIGLCCLEVVHAYACDNQEDRVRRNLTNSQVAHILIG
jgi:hypothetical protein